MTFSHAAIKDLTKRFGCPLYVFDESGFAENARELEKAMKSRYSRYQIAYSFKTNYTPYICSTAKRLGALAEVVSGMEYELAKRIGFADSQILFNGPDKGQDGIAAFLQGCMIQVDNLDELRGLIEAAAAEPEKRFKIGLRINLDLGKGFISRFGMSEEDAKMAFSLVEERPNMLIVGLHCHISRCRSLEDWEKRARFMLALADELFVGTPEYLDLGSGMFGSMEPVLAAQFDTIPSYEDYAEVTAGLFAEHYPGENGPLLITEPGTTLVSRFVDCIARVEAIKHLRNHDFAILNASVHTLGETCMLKRLPIQVIPCGAEQRDYHNMDLTGFTCLEQDLLFPGFSGKLAIGDYVVFGNVGGYSNVLKPPFIRPNCAMIAAQSDGGYVLMKRAERDADLLQTYVF